MLQRLRQWAALLKRDVIALWFAARSSQTPVVAKIIAGCVAGYALSPIDLIPDFIPVLGYLDDLIIVPTGVALVIRLIPPGLMAAFRIEADAVVERPTSRVAAALIIMLWLMALALVGVRLLNR